MKTNCMLCVELVALEDAQIKYSNCPKLVSWDKNGKGGIYNFVTKRGHCKGDRSKISWTQVETDQQLHGNILAVYLKEMIQ